VTGLDPRVVRVSGSAAEGTGYVLDGGLLLTSAEIAGTGSTTVTFRLPQVPRPWRCSMVWHRYDATRPRAARLDAALLRVLDPDWDDQWTLRPPPPLRWGRLATRRPSVPVSLTAFPDGKALVVHGAINAESAVKVGRYHVTLPGSAPDSAPTPWPGVPGAAVLCHGLFLGVVAQAVREPGTAWLSVVPAEALMRDPDFRALVAPGPVEAAELQPVLQEMPPRGQRSEPAEAVALMRWCEGRNPFAVRLVVGADDDYLRHLAGTLVQRMGGRDWAAGFVAADVEERVLGVVADISVPLLLVVDRADSRPGTLFALADAIARRAFAGPAAPVRLLLLADDAGDWWWDARGESPLLRDLPADTVMNLCLAQPPFSLGQGGLSSPASCRDHRDKTL